MYSNILENLTIPQAPTKQSPHLNSRYGNIVGLNMLRKFGHRVATFWVHFVGSRLSFLGPSQTLYFSRAESNANEKNPLFSFINIRFDRLMWSLTNWRQFFMRLSGYWS